MDIYTALAENLPAFESSLDADRRRRLEQLAGFVAQKANANEPIDLVFVCTHNSRRSHLGQVTAASAANFVGVPGVRTYSAGTETTAFNGNAIAALESKGCKITKCTADDRARIEAVLGKEASSGIDLSSASNPVYLVEHTAGAAPSVCFSKVLGDPSLPAKGFAAVMTCTSADAGCPVVVGAAKRVSLPYDDPKASDGTGKEAEVYGAKVDEIGQEMLWVMTEAKKKIAT